MRKIITSDIFNIARIIKENDLKSIVVSHIQKFEGKTDTDGSMGFGLFIDLMSDPKTQKSMYDFFNPIFECDVEKLPLDELMKNIEKLVSENDLKSVFHTVERLLKIKSLS